MSLVTNLKEPGVIPWYKMPIHFFGILVNPLKAISKIDNTYGDIIAFKLGNMRSIIFLNHPDYIKHILKDNLENYSRGKAFEQSLTGMSEMLGNGIFVADGKDWEFQHKMLKTLFTPTAIQQTLPLLNEEIDRIVQIWRSGLPKNNVISIEHEIHLLMLRIMLRSHVCKDYNFDFEKIFKTYNERINASSWNSTIATETKAFFANLVGVKYEYKKHQRQIAELNKFADILISELLEGKFEPVGLFKMMLKEHESGNVSVKDIRDQFFNFLLAGFETTATAISWLLYNIAAQPDLQVKLRNELSQAHVEDGTNQQLTTLQLTIKESLRLYAPVWTSARVALEDDVIGGYFIKAKSIVVINSFALHRHKSFWPSGDKFDITNFEKDNFKGKTFAYIPYSQGKRICLGMALADYQIQTITSALLKAFNFETTSNKAPEIKANIIIKASPSLQLKISKAGA